MYALEVLGASPWSARRPLGARPLVVGRATECDLILEQPSISRRHAAFRVHEGRVHVEDLRSRNGTFVDGTRIAGEVAVQVGAVVRLGSHDAVRVTAASVLEASSDPVFAVEDLANGHRIVLGTSPLTIGSDKDCALRLADGPAVVAVVLVQGDEVWLGRDDDMVQVEIDAPFDVLGRELVVRAVDGAPVGTAIDDPTPWPYVAKAVRDAPGGPLAQVRSTENGAVAELVGTNTAVLLYQLVRAWARDAARGVDVEERGWIDDDDVAVGVWGREGPLRQLKVLVCRLRQELREAGLDPWFVEKRRGALRIRVTAADVEGE
jgi:pSer/pThr/pTyr-binding forkhead associated (FHA) protein